LPISAVDAISPAFQHAKQQLLQPFRFSQWVRLAIVGFLAGELGSSGGCNSHFNLPSTNYPRGSEHFHGTGLPPQIAHHLALLSAFIVPLILMGLVLFVLFLYVNSVMRFILFDSIIAKECHIRQGWVRRRHNGRRFFLWQLVLTLIGFAVLILLIGIPVAFVWSAGWFERPSDHLFPLILGGILLFLLVLVFVVVMAVITVMTKDFVVPQMALEDISALEGWRRLWLLLKAETGGYAVYILMKIALAIAAAIALGIITLIVFLALLLPVGGLGVAAVLGGMAAGLTWNFYTIALAVVVGLVVLAALIFVASMISVPAIVFFPAYSIYFFAGRYPPLAALLWPPPVVSVTPVPPPTDAPPLPPAPAPLG
jgi:hypothetical protein